MGVQQQPTAAQIRVSYLVVLVRGSLRLQIPRVLRVSAGGGLMAGTYIPVPLVQITIGEKPSVSRFELLVGGTVGGHWAVIRNMLAGEHVGEQALVLEVVVCDAASADLV